MSKKPLKSEATESFGSDSFLDVVANMVGILIILVMVVGLRIKNSVEEPPPVVETTPVVDESAALEKQAAELRADTNELVAKAEELHDLALDRYDERDALAFAVASRERAVADRKAGLAEGERQAVELQQALALEKNRLAALDAEINALIYAPQKDVIKIKTYPTPMSRTVYGREAHFQLRGGKIALVPLDQLVEELKHVVQSKVYRLRDTNAITDTVGPLGGFRMRYTLERVDLPAQMNGNSLSPGGTLVRTTEFTLLPVSNDLGETWDDARRGGSDFQTVLADLDARRTTITLWTYPESFEDYRNVRAYLYERGFTVAGRPLPTGQPISGSPYGSKTSAQ